MTYFTRSKAFPWHDYVRAYAVRHWEDHGSSESAATVKSPSPWSELDNLSQQKVRQLLRGDTADATNLPGNFGLGKVRTREAYEQYAGVSFEKQKLQDYTRYAYEPPNSNVSINWTDGIYNWMVRVAVNTAALPPYALDEHSFWVVAIQDEDRREIRRHDFQRKDLVVDDTESQIVLIFEIQSGIVPAFWSVLPLNGFGSGSIRLEGALAETDFSIITD